MEFASFLAGERWSDHPACTHPLLAALARMVNDTISDERRPELAPMIPKVIGLNSEDPHMDAYIALRAATIALPVASAERQRVLAVAILSSERILAELDDRPDERLHDHSIVALARAPEAAKWAREFAQGEPTTLKGFRRYAGPTAVRCAVEGVAQACVPDPDTMLRDLLSRTIDDCAAWARATAQPFEPDRWDAACRLTGTVSHTS